MAKKKSTGFAGRLRELRADAGLTQAELADRAGMHLRGLTKLEQGEREPAWGTVLDLARALGVEVGAFVTDGPGEPARPLPRGRPRKAPEAPASGKPSGEKAGRGQGHKRKGKE
jgi:transcriptional regulator with XRE-family HTH domain